MSKIIVIPDSIDNISNINSDALLIGIEGYSVNTLNIEFDELNNINTNCELFISLNKNFKNGELNNLEKILLELNNYNIKGAFYYDVAVLNIANRLELNYDLIWSAEHYTTNYYTINYWMEHGIKGCFLSNDITIEEMLTIRENTNCTLFAQLFGYIPMYVSKRHAVKNYIKYFNLDTNSNKYYIYKEDSKYSIVDNKEGTMIYSWFILDGLDEYLNSKDKFEYVLLNGYSIDSDKLLSVIDIYKNVNVNNIEDSNKKLNSLFSNLSKGFLHEETIYRVKRNDK